MTCQKFSSDIKLLLSVLVGLASAGFSCPKACQDAVVRGLNAVCTTVKIHNALSDDNGRSEQQSARAVSTAVNHNRMRSKPTVICQDSCVSLRNKNTELEEAAEVLFTSDGECDDSGPNSKNDICFPGTDCSDCGAAVVEVDDNPGRGHTCPKVYDMAIDFSPSNSFKDICVMRIPLTTLLRLAGAKHTEAELSGAFMFPAYAGILVTLAAALGATFATAKMRNSYRAVMV